MNPYRILVIISLIVVGFDAAFAQQLAAAEQQSDRFSIGSSFRFRHETDFDTDYATYRNFSSMRIRTDLNFKVPEENFRIFLQPQFSKNFGEPVVMAASTITNTVQNTSGTTVDTTFTVHQGYLEYSINDQAKVVLGRQVLSYGDELVIGALDWNNVGRSFDGGKAKLQYSLGWTDFVYFKLTDNNVTTTSSGGDINLFGIYNSFDFGSYLKSFDLYYFQKDDDSQFVSKKLFASGARAASQIDGLDYRVEFTTEWGSIVSDSAQAYQYDAEVGYKLIEEALKPRLSAELFWAGKDYDQLYPTTHKWLGFADVFGRKNISGWAAHLNFIPYENFTALVDYHSFRRTSVDSTAFKTNGSTAIGTTTASASQDLGYEVDCTLKYKTSKSLIISGGYSFFSPGEYLKSQFSNKTPEFYFAQVEAIF